MKTYTPKRPSALCPFCGRRYTINQRGEMRRHSDGTAHCAGAMIPRDRWEYDVTQEYM